MHSALAMGVAPPVIAAGILLLAAGSVHAASFQGLGHLGDTFQSIASDISDDGSTVVGHSSGQAFRWNLSEGMVDLGWSASYARGVSADGSVVVGQGRTAASADPEAFLWTSASGSILLPALPDPSQPVARAVSADGSIVVGNDEWNGVPLQWTNGGAPVVLTGGLGAYDVSADGSVVAGRLSTGRPGYWTSSTGWLGVDAPSLGIAYAVSSDGGTIAGSSGQNAFRWTSAEGYTKLETLDDGSGGGELAWDVSADGAVIVGQARLNYDTEAVLWHRQLGLIHLETLLEIQGIDLTGWDLNQVNAVSADGLTFAGTGTSPSSGSTSTEAWIATIDPLALPEPGTGLLLSVGLLLASIRSRVWRSAEGSSLRPAARKAPRTDGTRPPPGRRGD